MNILMDWEAALCILEDLIQGGKKLIQLQTEIIIPLLYQFIVSFNQFLVSTSTKKNVTNL